MMVEFVGSTGAGKTTVAAAVKSRLAGRTAVFEAPELLAGLVGLAPPARPFQRNLLSELVGLPFLLGSLRRHGAFLRFSLRMLARQRLNLQNANRLRSTIRKLGVYEACRRLGTGRVVLVDEGTVLHAHNLFVFTNDDYSASDLVRFAGVVPLPDLIVYVRAPLDTSIRRALSRPDPPREFRSAEFRLVELYLRRARALFETLVAIPDIEERVVTVDNPGDQAGPHEPDVEGVVERILERAGPAG